IEIEHSEGRFVTGEALRQVARAARELAAIPGPTDPRPPAPGAKVNGVRYGSETPGGRAGKIMAAAREAEWRSAGGAPSYSPARAVALPMGITASSVQRDALDQRRGLPCAAERRSTTPAFSGVCGSTGCVSTACLHARAPRGVLRPSAVARWPFCR